MPPNGRFINWTDVSFLVTGSTIPIIIMGVTDIQIDPRGQVIAGAGDADLGPSSKHMTQEDLQVTIETEYLAILRQLTPGTRGVLSATHNDADNGEGTGAMIYTIGPCIVVNTPRGGRFRAYGTSRITFETYRPDGRTNPMAIAVAS